MTQASRREARLPIAKVTKMVGVVAHGAGSRRTGRAKVVAGKPTGWPTGMTGKRGLRFGRNGGHEKAS